MDDEVQAEPLPVIEPEVVEPEVGAIFSILAGVVDGWTRLAVRVKQDGKMEFLPLDKVKDQRLLLKYAIDLIKQAAKEEGIVLRRVV